MPGRLQPQLPLWLSKVKFSPVTFFKGHWEKHPGEEGCATLRSSKGYEAGLAERKGCCCHTCLLPRDGTCESQDSQPEYGVFPLPILHRSGSFLSYRGPFMAQSPSYRDKWQLGK